MKYPSLLKTLLFACGLSPAFAIEYYQADFSVEGEGSTHDSTVGDPLEMSPIAGANWQIRWDVDPRSDKTTNSFITSDGKLISDDWGGRAIFETDLIDVSSLDSIIVTTFGDTVGTDVFNSGVEDFTWFYVLDGGSRVSQFPIKADGSLDYSETVDVSGASSLVVGFEFEINGADNGFEIFSVRVDDSAPLNLTLTLPEGLAETALGGGMTEGAGQVLIAVAEDSDLVIDLTSSDLTEATVPATVTILAGNLSADFTVTSVDDLEADGDQIVTVTATAEGFTEVTGTLIVEDEPFVAPTIAINEIRTDNLDIDTEEYLEIYGATGDYSLDRIWLIVLGDGTNDLSGFVERAYDLTGLTATGKFFLVGNDNMTGAIPDLTLGINIFENNDSLTFLLVTDFTGARNDDLDTDNDGMLDVMPWGSILDAVSLLDTDFPPDSGGFAYAESLGFTEANLAPITGLTPAHLYRSPSGNGVWAVGPFGSAEEPAVDTPGTDNGGDPVILEKTTITDISVTHTTGQVILSATGLSDFSYEIQSSSDLGQSDDWAPVTGIVTRSDKGAAIDFTFTDPEALAGGKNFYRLLKQ